MLIVDFFNCQGDIIFNLDQVFLNYYTLHGIFVVFFGAKMLNAKATDFFNVQIIILDFLRQFCTVLDYSHVDLSH
jgi:hypothetical protein